MNDSFSMEVSVSSLVFSKENKNYIEIYSRIIANSVQFTSSLEDPEFVFSEIELLLVLKKGNELVAADKYKLESPRSQTSEDFWDMRRYPLSDGEYRLELQYVDLNNIKDTLSYSENIDLGTHGAFTHSDILFISDLDTSGSKLPFKKAGFYFEPLCFNHLNQNQNDLTFYTELYNIPALTDQECFIKYFIEQIDENSEEISSVGYKKVNQSIENAFLLNIDVSEYYSGNYNLVIEIYSRSNELLSNYSDHFTIFHPLIDIKSTYEKDEVFESSFVQLFDRQELDYSLKAIFPLVGNNMTETLNFIISNDEIQSKKYFLYHFWGQMNPSSPRSSYEQFMDVAKAVDLEYGNNVGHGFETDRGHLFIKYGKPDDIITVEDEPSAPPYEIWVYNYLDATQQTNVKFLFYNPSLAGNDFILLHSTCRGELSNPNWEYDLYRDSFEDYNIDNYHKNAKRYFTDF